MSTIRDDQHVILHLGLGSFHRAHQAVYLQDLHDRGDDRWVLAGGNLRPDMADTLAALQAQGGAYTLETVTPQGERHYRRIASIREVIAFDPALTGLVERGAQRSTRIVSFTVTEAGYYLDADSRLDPDHFADLASDLAGRTRCTIYGALAAILAARRARNAGPVTLLNCDNLRGNGDKFRAGMLDFLDRRGEHALRQWVADECTTPNAMVDRITPRPTPDVIERVRAAVGWPDKAPVMGEAFIQWVIEDHFAAGRPAWETVGAQMVASVLPFEEAKIRILNSSHCCIAWAGTLLGMTTIDEGTRHPMIRQLADDYVTDDVIPCLTPSPVNLENYRDVVLDRFSNAALKDTNQRVAMDGFSKIPGFLWPTIRERLAQGASIAKVSVLPALFFQFLRRWHEGGLNYTYQDQCMDPATAHAFFSAPDPLAAFANDAVLWGPLAGDARLLEALRVADRTVTALVDTNVVKVQA